MWLLVDLEAVRQHEARDELEAMFTWQTPLYLLPELSAATHRLLITARSGEPNAHWAVAAEHRLGPEALAAMFEGLEERCETLARDGVVHGVTCGRARQFIVAAPTPTLVVILRPEHADTLLALTGTGGLPIPRALAEGHVLEPSETFRGRQIPEIPATIERGYGELAIAEEGVTLLLQGTCANAGQAHAAADTLNRIVDDLPLRGPDIVKGAIRRMLRFEVEGKTVRVQKDLSDEQVRLFMLLVDAVSQRPRTFDDIP